MPLDIGRRDIVLLSGVRTAFGTMGGALKGVTATDLAVPTARAALERAGVDADEIDHVVYGNVLQTANDAIYCARHVGLKSGVPQRVPALTLNRLCGSGFQAIVNAAEQILTGQAQVVLAGGTENMSMAPHVTYGLRDGARFGKPPAMQDLLWECLTDSYTGMPMAITAENLADNYGITREESDAFALASQTRWAAAQAAGVFESEIVPVEIPSRKGPVSFTVDEHPRPTTPEALAKLPPVFRKDGRVTAGNASGICDGAASLVVADAKWAERKGLKPLARLVGWGVSGCDPTIMGIGPVPAAKRAFEQTGLGLDDMALVEVNEAFAPQILAVMKELGLDPAITNVNGGAIAMGHPLGASGARITATLAHELRRRGARYGLGSACIGGGQGIAVILEAYPSDRRRSADGG
jgi:acetyl-CoA C-acetyltransferase/acetyl-CoA acyltransferase 2